MYSRGLFNCTIIRENIDDVKWHKVRRNAIDANVDTSACFFVNVSFNNYVFYCVHNRDGPLDTCVDYASGRKNFLEIGENYLLKGIIK